LNLLDRLSLEISLIIFQLIYFIFIIHFSISQGSIFFRKLQSFSARSQKLVYLKASMQRASKSKS